MAPPAGFLLLPDSPLLNYTLWTSYSTEHPIVAARCTLLDNLSSTASWHCTRFYTER